MYHNGPNHPAKSGGLCVRSNKVEFSLVNRVSLIFKGMISIHSFKNIIVMYLEHGICRVLYQKIISGTQKHEFGMVFDV